MPTAENDAPYEPMAVTFDIRQWDDIRDLAKALRDADERTPEKPHMVRVSNALTTVFMNRAARVTPPEESEGP